MRILLRYRKIVVFLLLLLPVVAEAQVKSTTTVQGRVRDAETNEPMPFVQVVFEG